MKLDHTPTRRTLLGGAQTTLSIAALSLIVGSAPGAALAAPKSAKKAGAQDIDILNAAIALEHEGIAAYQIAATSGLLQPEVVKLGVTFQGHHKGHRDALIGAVRELGGEPVGEQTLDHYATALDAASLKNQVDVLRLALRLERGAANAYLGLIPSLGADYHLIAARMAGDEAFHVAILSQALGEPVPTEGLMFG